MFRVGEGEFEAQGGARIGWAVDRGCAGLLSRIRITRTVRLRNEPYHKQANSVICTASVRP